MPTLAPFEAINPATATLLQTYPQHTDAEVVARLQAVAQAQRRWQATPFDQRAAHMRAAAEVLRREQEPYALLMAEEMGKPLKEGRAEVEKCAWVCEYYATHAEAFLADAPIATDATRSFVTYRPLGVVLAVMPWNFPFWQVFRFVAPNLMAGNGGLLKHAANVPGCALAIEAVLREAGFPPDLFHTLLIGSDRVAGVIEHPVVQAVTLTGSTPAGRAVARTAGAALKKTVLELGGSDPYVILGDADVAAAAETCVTSRLINSGQSCIAAKRFIVVEPLRVAFEEKVVALMRSKAVGSPLDPATDVGPMARHDLRDGLHRQVLQSLAAGATCLLGGNVPEGPGAYYPPTVLTDVKPGMPAYDDELFGPVAAIIPVRSEDEAFRVANDTPFGLGAAVFTADAARGERLAAERLDAGCCFVNAFVRSDPRLPFGGIKASGYGRELSEHGIREFVNAKTVYVA